MCNDVTPREFNTFIIIINIIHLLLYYILWLFAFGVCRCRCWLVPTRTVTQTKKSKELHNLSHIGSGVWDDETSAWSPNILMASTKIPFYSLLIFHEVSLRCCWRLLFFRLNDLQDPIPKYGIDILVYVGAWDSRFSARGRCSNNDTHNIYIFKR